MSYDKKTLQGAIREASRRIKLASIKERNENLKMAAGDMAEAYEIGVEEAQSEIIARLRDMLEKLP